MSSVKAYAFFDVDDTLIDVKSMFSFQDYWYAINSDEAGHDHFTRDMRDHRERGVSREVLNRRYYTHFAGRSCEKVRASGMDWFRQLDETREDLYHTAITARLKQHQNDGVEAVFVSGSFPALLEPGARILGVKHILCTSMESRDGVFTGGILPPQTIGQGKADALLAFLAEKNADPRDCYAYGDDISDAPMLAAVGHPFAVRGEARLEKHAAEQGWPVLDAR